MSPFVEALRSGPVLLMDGGMGTELWQLGLNEEEDGSLWNSLYPERVQKVHAAYAEAGAEVVLTNTFQANPASFFLRSSPERLREVLHAGVALARGTHPPPRFVLADIGAFESGPEERVRHLRDCQNLLAAIGEVDAILAETWTDFQSLLSLMEANANSEATVPRPLLVSVTYLHGPNGKLVTANGESPQFWARQLSQQEAVVGLGINCGRDITVEDTVEAARRYRDHSDLPIFARPNAGTPTQNNGKWTFPHSPQAMADQLPALLEAGVRMVGGCCGTTPKHIAAFRKVIDKWNARSAHSAG